MNYLEELLKIENTNMLRYLLEQGIVKIDRAVEEAIKLKNGAYIFNLAHEIQKTYPISNGYNAPITATQKQREIEKLAQALVEIQDADYLIKFLRTIDYAKVMVAEGIIDSKNRKKIEELVQYLYSLPVDADTYFNLKEINKIKDDLLKKAIQCLVNCRSFDTLSSLIITYKESSFLNIALSMTTEEFLEYFKNYLAKLKAKKTDYAMTDLTDRVNQRLTNLQLANETLSDEETFNYLKTLYEKNDEETILAYKERFAKLFQETPEKGLTK